MKTENILTQYQFAKKVSELAEQSEYSRSELAKMLKITNSAITQSLGERYHHQTKLNGVRRKVLNILGYELREIPVHYSIDKLS